MQKEKSLNNGAGTTGYEYGNKWASTIIFYYTNKNLEMDNRPKEKK